MDEARVFFSGPSNIYPRRRLNVLKFWRKFVSVAAR